MSHVINIMAQDERGVHDLLRFLIAEGREACQEYHHWLCCHHRCQCCRSACEALKGSLSTG